MRSCRVVRGWTLAAVALSLNVTSAFPAESQSASPAPSQAPYSLPWQLRPVAAATVLRVDETLALFEDPASNTNGSTAVTSLIGSYRVSPRFAPMTRVSWVRNRPPGTDPDGNAFSNPLLGVTYLHPMRTGWRAAGFAAVTASLGQGGGVKPNAAKSKAVSRGVPARSSFDNAMFAVNYSTAIVGAGLARVDHDLTVQAEATLFRLFRSRGPATEDKVRTNLTAGIHAGRFFRPEFSLGADLRYQRWLTNVAPVRKDPAARVNVTFAIGPRFHYKLGGHWFRPGIAYARSLDRPFSTQSYEMLQLDLPLAF